MRKRFFTKLWAWMLIPCLTFTSCSEEAMNAVLNILDQIFDMLGYNMDTEDVDDQEKGEDNSDKTTGDHISWEAFCPPIGNQGSYGTCVVWATGYGLKTTLNRMDEKWTSVSSAQYQCSPVDLWHLMPSTGSNAKGTSCNGSNFDPAFQTLINKGVSSMSNVPFTNMKMTCDGVTGKGDATNKLAQYRIVAYSAAMSNDGKAYGMTVSNIKYYLTKGPLVFGAQLGNNFMKWNSSKVLTYDDDTYQGQHAYHAMMLVGFDDNKHAFRVRNSWGASGWGDNGSIWIDYDFFVSGFCFGVWSASNTKASTASAMVQKRNLDSNVKVTVVSDVANENGTRTVSYTIQNNGKSAINTANYPVVYVLFKTKHLAKKYIVMEKADDKKIQPGQTANFTHTYSIPSEVEDGKYTLALIADPYNEIGDKFREDNFSFVTTEMESIQVMQGFLLDVPKEIKEVRSLTSLRANAYENAEISESLSRMRK